VNAVLKGLAWSLGVACALIGVVHLVGGIHTVPGEGAAWATVDNRERYYGAIFFGYGLAWIWVVRQRPIPSVLVNWLAGIFLLGALGRIISIIEFGWPHWFQTVLLAIEIVLPIALFVVAKADERQFANP